MTQDRQSKRLQQHKASPEHWTAEGGQASAMIRSLKIDFIQRVLKPRRKTPPAERRRGRAASPGAVLKHLGCLGTTHGGKRGGSSNRGSKWRSSVLQTGQQKWPRQLQSVQHHPCIPGARAPICCRSPGTVGNAAGSKTAREKPRWRGAGARSCTQLGSVPLALRTPPGFGPAPRERRLNGAAS